LFPYSEHFGHVADLGAPKWPKCCLIAADLLHAPYPAAVDVSRTNHAATKSAAIRHTFVTPRR
jgi:hypothetical protein